MRSLTRFLCCFLVLVSPFAANANSKEDAARKLLEKASQQADIWTQGPMQLVADVTLPQAGKAPLQIKYTVWWASPNKWRSEWSGAGYTRVVVVNNGKKYRSSSLALPPLVVLEYELALAALNGNRFVGPTAATPDLDGVKLQVSNEKVGNVNAECISGKHLAGEVCIDPSSAELLSFAGGASDFFYSNYQAVGPNLFPTTIRKMKDKQITIDSRISVTVPPNLPDSLFVAPDHSTVSDYATCSDAAGTLQGGRLEKKVMPKYPRDAKMTGRQGDVMLYVILGKDGSVESLKAVSGSWPELQASALEAVADWKYTPYLRCGQPVEVETLISVNYSLSNY